MQLAIALKPSRPSVTKSLHCSQVATMNQLSLMDQLQNRCPCHGALPDAGQVQDLWECSKQSRGSPQSFEDVNRYLQAIRDKVWAKVEDEEFAGNIHDRVDEWQELYDFFANALETWGKMQSYPLTNGFAAHLHVSHHKGNSRNTFRFQVYCHNCKAASPPCYPVSDIDQAKESRQVLQAMLHPYEKWFKDRTGPLAEWAGPAPPVKPKPVPKSKVCFWRTAQGQRYTTEPVPEPVPYSALPPPYPALPPPAPTPPPAPSPSGTTYATSGSEPGDEGSNNMPVTGGEGCEESSNTPVISLKDNKGKMFYGAAGNCGMGGHGGNKGQVAYGAPGNRGLSSHGGVRDGVPSQSEEESELTSQSTDQDEWDDSDKWYDSYEDEEWWEPKQRMSQYRRCSAPYETPHHRRSASTPSGQSWWQWYHSAPYDTPHSWWPETTSSKHSSRQSSLQSSRQSRQRSREQWSRQSSWPR